MSRTNIDLDDRLVEEVMRRFNQPTKKAAVDFALRRVVTQDDPKELVRQLQGSGWAGDLPAMRAGDLVAADDDVAW